MEHPNPTVILAYIVCNQRNFDLSFLSLSSVQREDDFSSRSTNGIFDTKSSPLQSIFHQNGWVFLLNSQNSPFLFLFAALKLPRTKKNFLETLKSFLVCLMSCCQGYGDWGLGFSEFASCRWARRRYDLESFGKHTTQDGEISQDDTVHASEILLAHQLMLVVCFIIYRVLAISGGCLGFLPSTVVPPKSVVFEN